MKLQKSDFNFFDYTKKLINIAALFIGAAIIFYSCNQEVEKIEAFSSPENLPILSATDFETTYTDSFKVQFYMKAPIVQSFDSEGQSYNEFPKGILLVKYDSNERIISRITSDYARQYDKENKWEAKNNVVAVNSLGDTLKTELLIWEEKSGRIYSDKFVKIICPDKIIKGIGFESDQNLQNWSIKNVTGTLYIEVKQDKDMTEEEPLKPENQANMNKTLQFKN
jgi:LPS export ABC transporter protein LptC